MVANVVRLTAKTSPGAARRDERATALFADLYERHRLDVFRYALVLTRDPADADDVTSETFTRALGAWRAARQPAGPALPWLLVIARNTATDRWRRARRTFAVAAPVTPPADAAQLEATMWLRSVVAILPARQREVIALRYHRELSDAQIGSIMGLSESGVRSLVARAIATLRQHPEVWK